MKRTISAVEARKNLGEVLERVYHRNDEVVIERAGKPMAVLIPMYLYKNIERRREQLWQMIEEVHERNKDVPYEVIEAEVAEAIRQVREEQAIKPAASRSRK